MKVPLQTRVSFFVSLIIIAVSIVGTGIFTSAYEKSEERGLIARGTALGFALAKAAEEGLRQEDLDLIKKAADVIRTPDIALIQIYTDLWDAVDAYPLNHLHEPPLRQAVDHFKLSTASFSAKTNLGYDFYCPIIFK
jgi:hypothetical protein